jgi:hypothetical protein
MKIVAVCNEVLNQAEVMTAQNLLVDGSAL